MSRDDALPTAVASVVLQGTCLTRFSPATFVVLFVFFPVLSGALVLQMMALTLPTEMLRPNSGRLPMSSPMDDFDEAAGGSAFFDNDDTGGWDAGTRIAVPSALAGTSAKAYEAGSARRKRPWSGPEGSVPVSRPRPTSMLFGGMDDDVDDVMVGGVSDPGTDGTFDGEEDDGDSLDDDFPPSSSLSRRSPHLSSPAIAVPRGEAVSAGSSPLQSSGTGGSDAGMWSKVDDDDDDAFGGGSFVPPHLLSKRLTQSLASVPRRDIRHALANWA